MPRFFGHFLNRDLCRSPSRLHAGASTALVAAVSLVVILSGCSNRTARVEVPPFDPPGMTRDVFDKYDRDGDGMLTKTELSAAPGIVAAFKAIDVDGDGQLSQIEFEQHLERYSVGRIGAQSLTCIVNLNGQPVAGAVVDFIPEDFLAGVISPARAKTNRHGSGPVLPVEPGGLPGIAPGMYRVTISLKSGEREMLPAQYNSESQLGFEVSNSSGGAPATFNLQR